MAIQKQVDFSHSYNPIHTCTKTDTLNHPHASQVRAIYTHGDTHIVLILITEYGQ